MKKPSDFSDTLSRSASEARGILQQTASLLEAEWKRVVDAVDESDNVPEQLRKAVARFDDAMDDIKDYVATNGPKVVSEGVRRARDAGVPIPEDWAPGDTGTTGDVADAAHDGADEAQATPFTDGSDDTVDDTVDEVAAESDAEDDKS